MDVYLTSKSRVPSLSRVTRRSLRADLTRLPRYTRLSLGSPFSRRPSISWRSWSSWVVDTLDIQDCNSKGGVWVQSDVFFFENIHLHRIKVQTCPRHRLHTRFVWLVYTTSFCGVHGNLSYMYRTIIVPNSCGIYGWLLGPIEMF